ncbi:tol-pal system protein YbgF [Legionella geestiana]|uniref:tol-pal system protein YbgF n=1 Tax=Legionella geestiana TaxID=45065 RepID=UPI001092EA56|nr:tol-pal system protein YbgF [Legionella geestiana]QDQ39569.1 tol-pal system protein YbgF [Legionella geestiana]
MKAGFTPLTRALLCLSLSWSAFAEAPVVDDSENFALMENNQAAYARPLTAAADDDTADVTETPIARDTGADALTRDNAALINKIQGLQQELQELRGQLEVQAHDLKRLQEQQLSFYKDLDARLRMPSASTSPTDTSPKAAALPEADRAKIAALPAVAPTGVMTEQQSYLAAYELVKNRRFTEALNAMQAFTERYPSGEYTANAEYWLGELYLVKEAWPQAMQHFETVITRFPTSSKVSASMLKMGYALAASGDKAHARERLQQVVSQFPDTQAALLARERLETLKAG